MRPNILYLHTHDAGRYIEPYGYAVPTPNLMALARRSLVFRHMHCAAPTCSASRVGLLTGQAPHSVGCLGLAHRGWPLPDPSHHLVHHLAAAGYETVLSGTQHEHTDAKALGYHRVLRETWDGREEAPAFSVEDAAAAYLREDHGGRPFFLSVGFNTTHRTFPAPLPADDEDYCRPPEPLPDTAVTRRDMACYKRAAAILDQQMGRVLQALDDAGLAESTLVVCTTDHGVAFPHMKCNLTDFGTGVFFMLRWPGRIRPGVTDALASQVDLFPTLCEWCDLPAPPDLQGVSLAPVVADHDAEVNEAVFSGVTYHAATEIMRAARTRGWLYLRRWDPRLKPVGTNCDVGYSKRYLVARGMADQRYAEEELYDCTFDPLQRRNVAADPANAKILDEMRGRLAAWMERSKDPLLGGVESLPPNPKPEDPDAFDGNVGGAPLPTLPERLEKMIEP